MAQQTFPRDRFDEIPSTIDRVGAHRAPERPGRSWRGFLWAAGATIVLVSLGIVGVMLFNEQLLFQETEAVPTAEPTVTAPPTVDPGVPVIVLNGTTANGLAAGAGDTLAGAGFTVGTASNAESSDIEVTAVYHTEPELEGVARGVAEAIGGADVRFLEESPVAGASLILVLGADYLERVTPSD